MNLDYFISELADLMPLILRKACTLWLIHRMHLYFSTWQVCVKLICLERGGKSYWSNWRTVRANVARHLEDFNIQHVPSITESSNFVETSQSTSNSLVENEKPCDLVFDNNSIVQELNNDISSQSDYDNKDRSINHSLNGIN